MEDKRQSKEQLINELTALRQRVAELEESKQNHELPEEEVQENEERFRAAFTVSPNAMAISTRENSVWIDINPVALKMFEYTLEEIIGRSTSETNLWVDLQDRKRFFEKLGQNGEVRNQEVHLRRKDDSVIIGSVSARTLTLKGAEHILFVIEDITERKEAEATAKRLAHEDSVLAEIGRIISSTFNIEEVYKSFSEKVRELIRFDRISIGLANTDQKTISFPYTEGLFIPGREPGDIGPLAGSTVEKMLQTHAGMIIAMESEEEIASSLPALLSGFQCGIRSALAVPLISGDRVIGTLVLQSTIPGIYTEQDLKLVQSIGNQIAGAIANAELYISLKETEKSLRRNEERFRELYDSAPVGYHEYDINGRIMNMNRTEQEILGCSWEERIGEYVWKFASDKDTVRREVLEKLAGLRPPGHSFEQTFHRKDGTILTILLENRLNKDEEGKITGMKVTIQDIADQKRAAEALRESEARFRSLIEGAPEAIFVQSGGRFVYLNPPMVSLLGAKTTQVMLGKEVMTFVAPEFREGIRDRILMQQKTGNPVPPMEEEHLRLDGSRVRVEATAVPIQFQGNEAHLVFVRDITERKEREKKLKESEEELWRTAQEIATVAEIGRIISSTLNIDEVYERFADEVRKLIPFDSISVNIIDYGKAMIATSYTSGNLAIGRGKEETWSLIGTVTEAVALTRSGRIIEAEEIASLQDCDPGHARGYKAGLRSVMAVPLISKDRVIGAIIFRSLQRGVYSEKDLRVAGSIAVQIAGAIANAQLYNERQQAEAALRKSETGLAVAQRIAHIGSWEWDVVANSANWSEETYRIFGVDSSDLGEHRQSFLDMIHPEDRRKVDQALSDALEGRKDYDIEYRIILPDKTEKVIHARAEVLRENQGKPILMRGTVHDITESKSAEEEREKLQTQLIQAQKMESVGRLAGGVAHDFNNKLSVIMGYAEIALKEVDPGGNLHCELEQILEAAGRSADLTRQLLAFARKQTVSPKVLNLNDTVSGMLKMLQRLIGEDIGLIWSPLSNLWKLKIDPSQIDQVLANLTVNARDAISTNGTINIKTENLVLDDIYCTDHPGCIPGEYVRLKVSDTGSGMSKDVLDHIFEPFFTTKGVGKGTGLGLSTVYGIIKQNNGFISEVGKGTTFDLYLPRFEGETTQRMEETEEAPKGTETILLVEDEEPVLKLTTKILESLGYTVLAAQTPEQAIHLIETGDNDIHLLITDVVMPELDGRELVERITTIKPGLRCLYTSGYTADVITQQGVLDEGVHFIEKPFKKSEIAKKVREVLNTHP